MRRSLLAIALLLLPLAAGCGAGRAASVPVFGARGELAALAGRWEGEYSSDESGRSGSIVFALEAGNDQAFGDVLMVPRGATQAVRPAGVADRPGAPTDSLRRPTSLGITFVRIEGGRVSGTLESYRDPDTGSVVTTTFVGTIDGDTIAGTYTTTGAQLREPQTGRWSATRRPSR